MLTRKNIFVIVGIVAFLIICLFLDLEPGEPDVTYTLAIAVLMAIWWASEAVPIAVTALLPVVLFPLFGIMDGKDVSAAYINHIIFLFIGGFLMAIAMEKHNLHRRIALKILLLTGTGFAKVLLGFMLATAFLSMWMSNTATAMMMVPVAISIIAKSSDYLEEKDATKYSTGLLFGIAYSASIGGIATLLGTPPNLSFTRIFSIIFPNAPEISFAEWFIFAFPISVVMFIIAWLLLYFMYRPKNEIKGNNEIIERQYAELSTASRDEKILMFLFVTLALLWIFRAGINFDSFKIPGWSNLFSHPKYINDGTVAIIIAFVLYLIPSKNEKFSRLLETGDIAKLPWHIVLLFGGGFALAQGFVASGLAIWFGEQLQFMGEFHPFVIIFIIALLMSFLTELTSNTATTEMLLPILAGIAVKIQINPLVLMLPATLAASLAFMLPVATPPNAVVFGTDKLTVADMMRTGIWLNLVGVGVVSLAVYYFAIYIFGIDLASMPDWAVIEQK
ncbi:MAG: SLC13/DASS family transporter [Flavobacteriales bacterium]|nr:SLC13/DASS family transporter [Flavobacteriales bacterium]